jgi:CBS domain-containing protein
MLAAGVQHIREPRELIEEVMYEKVLATRLKLERFLPFIAITAASAPLLGLLGTVTGIINTFKLITVFGSGDVKTLSGGISEALITTEFGLIVAIPSLLLHAFLSRKARGIVNQMEKAAVAFVNQVSKTHYRDEADTGAEKEKPDSDTESAEQLFEPEKARGSEPVQQYPADLAGGIMNSRMVSLDKTATVGDAVNRIRSSEINEDIESVFVVDENGKYIGHVGVNQLLRQPDTARMEALAEAGIPSVHIDTHRDEVHNLLSKHNLLSMPVVDHDDRLVGQVSRNGNGDGEKKANEHKLRTT